MAGVGGGGEKGAVGEEPQPEGQGLVRHQRWAGGREGRACLGPGSDVTASPTCRGAQLKTPLSRSTC